MFSNGRVDTIISENNDPYAYTPRRQVKADLFSVVGQLEFFHGGANRLNRYTVNTVAGIATPAAMVKV